MENKVFLPKGSDYKIQSVAEGTLIEYTIHPNLTPPPEDGRTIVVDTNGPDWDDLSIRDVFEKYGNIAQLEIIELDNSHGKFFVRYDTATAAERAYNILEDKLPDDFEIKLLKKVKYRRSPPARSPIKNAKQIEAETRIIRVFNVDPSVTEDDLSALFDKFGRIISIDKINKNTYEVWFEDERDAKDAYREVNLTPLQGKIIELELH